MPFDHHPERGRSAAHYTGDVSRNRRNLRAMDPMEAPCVVVLLDADGNRMGDLCTPPNRDCEPTTPISRLHERTA